MYILIRALLWIISMWRWGDWRNWKKYQASIQFFILGDLLYNFLCYNYSMWQYTPTQFLPSHTATTLFITFINYPCAVTLYLGNYPKGIFKQILWVMGWVFLWALAEWTDGLLGLITYHHGWNFWWSVAFMSMAVPMVRLHFKKPLLTYGLSAIVIVFMMVIFKVPIYK